MYIYICVLSKTFPYCFALILKHIEFNLHIFPFLAKMYVSYDN